MNNAVTSINGENNKCYAFYLEPLRKFGDEQGEGKCIIVIDSTLTEGDEDPYTSCYVVKDRVYKMKEQTTMIKWVQNKFSCFKSTILKQ